MAQPATIRPYEPRDAAAITSCIAVLQDVEHHLEADRLPGAAIASAYLEQILGYCARQSGRIFVAEREASVVGFVCVVLEHDAETVISTLIDYAYITDLVVLPDQRHQGIGTALLRHAEEYARARGMAAVKIGVLARNAHAYALYRHVGFRDYELTLIKELETR